MSIPNETQKHKSCSVKLSPINSHKLLFYNNGFTNMNKIGKAKRGKWRKLQTFMRRQSMTKSPNKCISSLLLGLPFLWYTKLDLICRSKYCCSKSNNLGTRFAGHSKIKSLTGELLHRPVRWERGTNLSNIY